MIFFKVTKALKVLNDFRRYTTKKPDTSIGVGLFRISQTA